MIPPHIQVGALVSPQWNAAKILGDEMLAYQYDLRVEAIGADWLVLRKESSGLAYAATFETPMCAGEFFADVYMA